jgi:hypothetical protein
MASANYFRDEQPAGITTPSAFVALITESSQRATVARSPRGLAGPVRTARKAPNPAAAWLHSRTHQQPYDRGVPDE